MGGRIRSSNVYLGELEQVDKFPMFVRGSPLPLEEVGEAFDVGLLAGAVVEPAVQGLHLVPRGRRGWGYSSLLLYKVGGGAGGYSSLLFHKDVQHSSVGGGGGGAGILQPDPASHFLL